MVDPYEAAEAEQFRREHRGELDDDAAAAVAELAAVRDLDVAAADLAAEILPSVRACRKKLDDAEQLDAAALLLDVVAVRILLDEILARLESIA
jgi:hypothetical protein